MWLRVLEPLSVPFVILLTVVAVLIERSRDREKRRRYDARIRADAYELLIILASWTVDWPTGAHPESEEDPPTADEINEFLESIRPTVDEGREVARSLVTDAPAASSSLAEMAREVYPRVASLSILFQDLVAIGPPGKGNEEHWIEAWGEDLATYRENYLDRAIDTLTEEVEDLLLFP